MTGPLPGWLLAALLLLTTAASASQATYQLRVDGLACPFCAYGIEKRLTRTEGVASIAIDIEAGVVTVTMAQGATLAEEQAKRIVEEAGFTLGDFRELATPAPSRTD